MDLEGRQNPSMTQRLLGLGSRKMELPATDKANLEFGVWVEGQVLGRVPGAQFFTCYQLKMGRLIGIQMYESGVWGRGWSWRAVTWGKTVDVLFRWFWFSQ